LRWDCGVERKRVAARFLRQLFESLAISAAQNELRAGCRQALAER